MLLFNIVGGLPALTTRIERHILFTYRATIISDQHSFTGMLYRCSLVWTKLKILPKYRDTAAAQHTVASIWRLKRLVKLLQPRMQMQLLFLHFELLPSAYSDVYRFSAH